MKTTKSSTNSRFVARIRLLRKHRGMSQAAMAIGAGIPLATIQRTEAEQRKVSLDEAVALCNILVVDLADMVSEEPLVITDRVQLN